MTDDDNADRQFSEYRRLMHLEYVRMIESDPSIVDQARRVIAVRLRGSRAAQALLAWEKLLQMPTQTIIQAMTEDAPEGEFLRMASPFHRLLGGRGFKGQAALWAKAAPR